MIKSTRPHFRFPGGKRRTQISKFQRHFIKMVGPFFLFMITGFVLAFSAKAQDCSHVVCTSNDVRPISAYLSGPGGAAIDCNAANPFDNAELHLVLTTNTQRIGVSISGYLKFDANDSVPFSNCFTGVQLNENSPNDLTFSLGSLLHDAICTDNFTLSNIFIAWGTGNTDFCNGSTTAECPATPSKCRFKPGEIITVTVKLDVDFTFTVGNCQDQTNLTVDFTPSITAQNINDPLSLHWDFGDGNTYDTTGVHQADISSAGTQHTYASANTYTVTLTITDGSEPPFSKTATHDITLQDCEQSCIPPAECTDDLTQCATPGTTNPPTAVFDLTKSACNSQVNGGWFTDPGFLVADMIADPTSVTASDGTVVYGLIFDDCGDQATATVTLHVNGLPSASAGSNSPVCAGSTLNLTSGPDNETSYSWTGPNSFSDGTQNPSIPNVTAAVAGTYIVTVTDANGCSATASTSVTVNALPAPTAGSNSPLCEGSTLNLTSGPDNETSYSWTGPNSFSNGTQNPSIPNVTDAEAGTYTVTVTDANGCSATASTSVTVNPVPSCTITNTTSSGSTTAGVGVPVSFSGPNAPAGSTYGYAWSFSANTAGATFAGGASTATTQAVTVTTTGTGSYTLSLTVTDKTYTTNCYNTCTYTVTINTSNVYYTVTQGFYGNLGGKTCTPSGTLYTSGAKGNTPSLMSASIQNMVNHVLFLGVTNNNRTFTMHATTSEENNLIKYMPATQAATVISANSGSNNNTDMISNFPKLYNKKISDVLLGQTITLDLNVHIPGNNLGSFILQNGYLTTQKADLSTCPSTKVVSCSKDNTTISSLQITTSLGLQNWIASGTKTVNDLLALASNALGGASLPSGVSLTDINNAVNVINTSFDGGRFFIGYYATQKSCSNLPTNTITSNIPTEATSTIEKTTVSVYPNPFNDQVKFVIHSPVSGRATLEVFNMLGQKIRTIFNGQVFAGMPQTVEFNVPYTNRVNMIYILKLNGQQLVGKLISMKQ